MIAVSLIGGLGNQMFQYAAGRALALRHATDLVLDVALLEHPPRDVASPRAYALGAFALRCRIVHGVRAKGGPAPGAGRASRVLAWANRRSGYVTLRQKGLEFSPGFFEAPDRTHLSGFWQSERYFAAFRETIRDDFRFSGEPMRSALSLLSEIGEGQSVSVHVRRGDYVTNPAAAEFHGNLDPGYYALALDEIRRRVGDVRAFVFSDDPDWCREHLRLDVPATVVTANGGDAVEDMRALAACRHHIIANSSFSWWGAWLGERSDSVVVAPAAWVADSSVDTSHVVPARWLRV